MASDDVDNLIYVYDEGTVIELTRATYGCGIIWSKIGPNQYYAQKSVPNQFWEFYISKQISGQKSTYILNIFVNKRAVLTINSISIPDLEGLFDAIEDKVLDPLARLRRIGDVLSSLPGVHHEFHITGLGGVLVGGSISNIYRDFGLGGVLVSGSGVVSVGSNQPGLYITGNGIGYSPSKNFIYKLDKNAFDSDQTLTTLWSITDGNNFSGDNTFQKAWQDNYEYILRRLSNQVPELHPYNSNGQYTTGSGFFSYVIPNAVNFDSDGNVLIAGNRFILLPTYNYPYDFVKLDGQTKALVWGISEASSTNSATVDSLNNVYITGGSQYQLRKYTSNGTFVWGYQQSTQILKAIFLNNYIYTVGVKPLSGSTTHKFDLNGNLIGSVGTDTTAFDIAVDSQGFFYTVGYDDSSGPTTTGYIKKYDQSGNLIWKSSGSIAPFGPAPNNYLTKLVIDSQDRIYAMLSGVNYLVLCDSGTGALSVIYLSSLLSSSQLLEDINLDYQTAGAEDSRVGQGGVLVSGTAAVSSGSGPQTWYWETTYWHASAQSGNDIQWVDVPFLPTLSSGQLPGNCSASGILQFKYNTNDAIAPPSGLTVSNILQVGNPYNGEWLGSANQTGSIFTPYLVHDANILGVEVDLGKSAFSTVSNQTPTVVDGVLEISNNGTLSPNKAVTGAWQKADLPFPATKYGGQSDLWSFDGTINPKITGADFDSNFFVLIKGNITSSPPQPDGTVAEVNCLRIGVFYQLPAASGNCAICKTNPTSQYTCVIGNAGSFNGTYVMDRVSDLNGPTSAGGRWQAIVGSTIVTLFMGYETSFGSNQTTYTAPAYMIQISVVETSTHWCYFSSVYLDQKDCAAISGLSLPFSQGSTGLSGATCSLSAG